MTKSQIFVLFLSIIVLINGVTLALKKNEARHIWHALQQVQHNKDELLVEWNQLLLQRSSLATGPMLDQNIRRSLDMTIPDPTTVVYIKNEKIGNLVKASK